MNSSRATLRLDRRVADAAARDQRQAVQRHPLVGHHRAALGVPVRFAVGALHEVRRRRARPTSGSMRAAIRPYSRLVSTSSATTTQRGGRLREHRARRQDELRVARARDSRASRLRAARCATAARRAARRAPASASAGSSGSRRCRVAGDAAQLPDEVLPLADAQVVQELLAAHPPERVAGPLLPLLAQVAPEVEVGDEVGVLVGEPGVLLPCGLLAVGGPLARVGDRQRRGDHQHLAHAALVRRPAGSSGRAAGRRAAARAGGRRR